jgi:hypothetical protein
MDFARQSEVKCPVQDTFETPCALFSCSRQLKVLNRAFHPLLSNQPARKSLLQMKVRGRVPVVGTFGLSGTAEERIGTS